MLVLAAGVASAQTTATLVGLTVDVSGARIPGARVTVKSDETGASRLAVTDDQGRFTFAGLPAGVYSIRAELPGFRPDVRTGLRLSVAEQLSLTLTLEVSGGDYLVDVVGAALLNTRSSELSFLVDERTMARIPLNGRNYTDLMSLQPGVNLFPHRDNGSVVAHGLAMSVNGQDPRANVYLLDGTLLNDFTNGPAGSAAGTALGMETVREFRVESNSYSAEFGRGVGGQVNAITKSGTNRTTGSALEFHRNEALDARNYFDVGPKPDFTRNQFGGTLGGPIRQNRLFLLRRIRGAAGGARAHRRHDRAGRQRAAGHPAVRAGGDRPGGAAVPRGVPARQRREPRRRTGAIHVPIRSEAGPELLPGAARCHARRGRSSVRPVHD